MVSGVLAEALERHRDYYNQRFHKAQALQAVDPAVFTELLVQVAQPALAACDELSEAQQDRVTHSLYDALLMLAAAPPSLRTRPVLTSLSKLLQAFAGLLGTSPGQVVRLIFHGTLNVHGTAPLSATAWAERLGELTTAGISVDELKKLGVAAAWKAGLAHYRKAALEVLGDLEPGLCAQVLDCKPSNVSQIISELGAERFPERFGPESTSPVAGALGVCMTLGGFEGLGGPFPMRPELGLLESELVVVSGQQRWIVHADCFGSYLEPTGSLEYQRVPNDRNVQVVRALEAIGPVAQHATADGLTVATSEASYQLFVLR